MASDGADASRSWWALVVPVADPAHEERLIGRLDRDCLGAELRGSGTGSELVTYFDSRARAEEMAASLKVRTRIEELVDGKWVERYQASLAPFDLTPGLRVDPTGGSSDDARTIRLVPGRAFGTGEHPTTRLSALALEKYVQAGTRWVDLGCGSAILAIVARRLGAARVLAIDLDPEAIEVAAQVLRQNRIEQVELSVGSFELAGRGWDGVVANILSSFFVDHAAALAPTVSPAGWLVASGYEIGETSLMERTLTGAGFEVVERFEVEGWGAMVCRRSGSP